MPPLAVRVALSFLLVVAGFGPGISAQAPPRPEEPPSLTTLVRTAIAAEDRSERRDAERALQQAFDEDPATVVAALFAWGSGLPADVATGRQQIHVPVRAEDDDWDVLVDIQVPDAYTPERAWPVLMLIHGTGSSGGAILDHYRALADDLGAILVAPWNVDEDPRWNFDHGELERAIHVQTLDYLARRYHLDAGRVAVAGQSRGGHGCWDLALHYPGMFQAIHPMVGGPSIQGFRYLPNAAGIAIRQVLGGQDDALLVQNVRMAVERLADMGNTVNFDFRPDEGHAIDVDAATLGTFLRSVWNGEAVGEIPRRVSFVCNETANDTPWTSAWLRVTRVDDDAVEIPRRGPAVPGNFNRMPTDEQREAFADSLARYRAEIDATYDRDTHTLTLTTEHVERFDILLDPRLLADDLTAALAQEGITLRLNDERPDTVRLRWDLPTLLDDIRERPFAHARPLLRIEKRVR